MSSSSKARRFYVPAEQIERPTVSLGGSEGRHLISVLRARPGQPVALYDEKGRTRRGTIQSIHPRRGEAEIEFTGGLETVASLPPLDLAVGVLKGPKLDEVIRFAASVGVRNIIPFTTSRSVAAPSHPVGAGKMARWQRIAAEACKISAGTTPPAVSAPAPFAWMIDRMSSLPLRILLWEGFAPSLTSVLGSGELRDGVGLVAGPEGGFSDMDVRASEAAGFRRASLGLHVLRTEVAVQSAVILVLNAMGRLG